MATSKKLLGRERSQRINSTLTVPESVPGDLSANDTRRCNGMKMHELPECNFSGARQAKYIIQNGFAQHSRHVVYVLPQHSTAIFPHADAKIGSLLASFDDVGLIMTNVSNADSPRSSALAAKGAMCEM